MKITLAALILVLATIATASADPLAAMRGVPMARLGSEGKSTFVVGENSRWEMRSESGALIANGTYAMAGRNTLCLKDETGPAVMERSSCMRYASDAHNGMVTALWDTTGQRIWLAVAEKRN